MNIDEMTFDDIEERRAQIAEEMNAENADVDALTAEARALLERKTALKAAEEERRKTAEEVASGKLGEVKEEHKQEESKMSNLEVRKSHEYNMAFAEYIKTGNDAECRALLTENVSGTVPVAEYAENRVRTAWDREGIMSRVRKTYLKGNLKIGFEISADGAYVHTEAANTATTEEALVLGVVNLIPASIKKWISISDEVYDMKGEEFLDYIYDELTYRIAKKAADQLIAKIEACGTASTTDKPAVPVVTATTVTVGLVAQALAQLSDEAANPVVIMNKQTWEPSRLPKPRTVTATIRSRVCRFCSTTRSPHSAQRRPALPTPSLATSASVLRLTTRTAQRSTSSSTTRPRWNTTSFVSSAVSTSGSALSLRRRSARSLTNKN